MANAYVLQSSSDEGPRRVSYNEWRSFLIKLQSKAVEPQSYKSIYETPAPKLTRTVPAIKYANNVVPKSNANQTVNKDLSASLRSIYETPAPKHTRTVVPAIKNANNVPPKSNAIQTVTQDLSASLRSIYETPTPKYTRTVVPVIKNANTVPPKSKAIQTVTQDLSASLRSIYETFWSLNSSAKLIHVKSQLDEPSKIYVHKLIKAHSSLVQENSRLKKEKQDLINVIKKIEIAISNETIANLIESARCTQPKNS